MTGQNAALLKINVHAILDMQDIQVFSFIKLKRFHQSFIQIRIFLSGISASQKWNVPRNIHQVLIYGITLISLLNELHTYINSNMNYS